VLTALRDPQRQARMRTDKSAQRYKVALEQANANLKALATAGVRIAMGTDTGPPARFQGYFEHMELDMMAKAGLSPSAIVAAATGAPGDCLQIPNTGYLRRGAYADFLVLSANPLADVRNFHSLESVWIGGKNIAVK
jgi:imidazolonepropionase-like amidohydrolase